MKRREFLKLIPVSVAVFLGLRLSDKQARAATPLLAERGEHKWAMVIDQSKCNGCNYCVNACRASNDINPQTAWITIYESEEIAGQKVYTPVACQHCEHAPCVSVCPVGASYYREDGIVMMDYERCIGCRYCQVACPFGARSFNWETFDGPNPAVPEWGEPEIERRPRGVAEKCTFCSQRIDRGLAAGLTPGVDAVATPNCVNVCPNGARLFGDLNDPDSPVSRALANAPSYRLRESLGTGPRVYYLPPQPQSEESPA